MKYFCRWAYRQNGDPNIRCRKLLKDPWCGHVYYCPNTKRTELSEGALKCRLREKQDMSLAKSIL